MKAWLCVHAPHSVDSLIDSSYGTNTVKRGGGAETQWVSCYQHVILALACGLVHAHVHTCTVHSTDVLDSLVVKQFFSITQPN